MKPITKLLVLGSAIAGAVYLGIRRSRRARSSPESQTSPDADLGMITDADLIEEIVIVGIADVDPDLMPPR